MAETAEAVEEKTEEKQDQQEAAAQEDSKTQVQSVEFSEATGADSADTSKGSIDILLDMNVSVTVAIGKTEIPIRRLLQLGPGSVLELDKSVDAPADLYLNDTRFATGNIVVVDGRFAVRIDQVLGLENSDMKAAQA